MNIRKIMTAVFAVAVSMSSAHAAGDSATADEPHICGCPWLPARVDHQLLDETLKGELLISIDRLPIWDGEHRGLRAGAANIATVFNGHLLHEKMKVSGIVERKPH